MHNFRITSESQKNKHEAALDQVFSTMQEIEKENLSIPKVEGKGDIQFLFTFTDPISRFDPRK